MTLFHDLGEADAMTPEQIDKSLPEYLADLIVAVRDKVRTQVLEEAAKVAEGMERDRCCGDIAAAIRALQKG